MSQAPKRRARQFPGRSSAARRPANCARLPAMENLAGLPASPSDTKPCPACGETIKTSALKCRFCGEDIEAFVAKREGAIERTLFSGHPVALYSIGRWLLA